MKSIINTLKKGRTIFSKNILPISLIKTIGFECIEAVEPRAMLTN